MNTSADGEPRPIYGGLYMAVGYGEEYFFPTYGWQYNLQIGPPPSP
jgi:hypothetical protein